MKNKILAVSILLCLAITGCGNATNASSNNDMISIEEYNKVVDERDYYKELYEKSQNIDKSSDNAESSDNATAEYSGDTQMIVDVNPENFSDYIEYLPYVVSVDYIDGKRDKVKFLLHNKLYDEGWVYYGASKDFLISVDDDEGQMPFMVTEIDKFNVLTFDEGTETLKINDVHGQLKFERIEAVQSYKIDDFNLSIVVKFSDGKTRSDTVPREQLQSPY